MIAVSPDGTPLAVCVRENPDGMPARALVAVLVGAAALALAAPARADASSQARVELERGYELRSRGNYVEALPHLLESFRLDPKLKTLINLADCEEHVGKLVDARAHWAGAREQAARENTAPVRSEAERRVADLDARTPKLRIFVGPSAPAAARVEEDGAPLDRSTLGAPTPTDPGRHVLVVRADGYEPGRYEVILNAAEQRELVVDVGATIAITATAPPETRSASPTSGPERGAPMRVAGLVTAGVGVVGVGVGAYFGLDAIQKKSAANCPQNECDLRNGGDPARQQAAMQSGRLSTIFFVAGAAVTAAGVTLWLVAPRTPRAAGISLAPRVAFDGGGFAVDGRW
jgi:hypothetical protein